MCVQGVSRGMYIQRGCLEGVCVWNVTINSLQEHEKNLKDVTLSKVSDFAFIMMVYEIFFLLF